MKTGNRWRVDETCVLSRWPCPKLQTEKSLRCDDSQKAAHPGSCSTPTTFPSTAKSELAEASISPIAAVMLPPHFCLASLSVLLLFPPLGLVSRSLLTPSTINIMLPPSCVL